MRMPFCILSVMGDVLDEGELRFVEAARTLEAAKRRTKRLAKSQPGVYVIYNGETGEEFHFTTNVEGRDRRHHGLRGHPISEKQLPHLNGNVPKEGPSVSVSITSPKIRPPRISGGRK